VLKALGELGVENSVGWLLGEVVGEFVGLLVLVMRAVLDVMVVTESSCFTNMTTTPMSVPNATSTSEATPTIMNFLHFTVQPVKASLSASF
jgi:hypothetical protein